MQILFIGNSKTYRQNFPGIFKRMVESSGQEIYIDKATKPGASLIELFQESETLEKIKSKKWDYVVIQERTIKALQDDISEFEEGATSICNKIVENNPKTKIIYNAVGVYCDFNLEEYETTNKHYEQIAELTNGVVTYSGNANDGYGYYVIISHGNGVSTVYAHCSQLLVSAGQTVSQGTVIAKVGSTGNSTGNHLHFEVRKNGVTYNPQNYVY